MKGTYTLPTESDGARFNIMPEFFTGCVQDGPFANYTNHVGPGKRLTDHCIIRQMNTDRPMASLTHAHIQSILNQPTYDEMWNAMDGIPFKEDIRLHDAGHIALGGEMVSFYTSSNEPAFWIHHAGLDRIWWKWQNADLSKRLYDVAGRVNNTEPPGALSMDYPLPFADRFPSVTVESTVDTRAEPYCYTYDSSAAARGASFLLLSLPLLVALYL